MEINIKLSFVWLVNLETAVAAFSFKQKHERGYINDEILKKELLGFLNECPNILGPRENRRKNIQAILDEIKSRSNLRRDYWNHKIIQEVLIKLLES